MDWPLRSGRRPVFNEPGHAHELTFTCFRRFRFLAAERTCLWFAEAIDEARRKQDFALWAYVFMPEHAHLIVYPRRLDYDVSAALKAIKEPVGRKAVQFLVEQSPDWLPRITVQRGQRSERRFWQAGGGYDRNVTETKTLRSMVEYIHLNPVRRGLVAQAEEWKWSSAGWLLGGSPNTLRPDAILPEMLDPY